MVYYALLLTALCKLIAGAIRWELDGNGVLTDTTLFPDIEVKIMVMLGGKDFPNDEQGELRVSAPTLCKEYWRDETATRDAFSEDRWFRTGNVASIDKSRRIRIVARKKASTSPY